MRSWAWISIVGCTPPTGSIPSPDTGVGIEPDPHSVEQWVVVDAHPCAQNAEGWVRCWSGSDGVNTVPAVPDSPVPMMEFTTFFSREVIGLDFDGNAINWFCEHNSGSTPSSCFPPTGEFRHIASGAGLRPNGEIEFWDEALDIHPPGTQVLFAPVSQGTVSLSSDNVVRSSLAVGTLTEVSVEPRDYVEIAPFGRAACLLDSAGGVECHGVPVDGDDLPLPAFENGPYVDIAGNPWSFCAKRADHVLECHNGETFDFGPIRTFAVDNQGYYVDDASPLTPLERIPATLDGPFGLCVVTESNAIECVGPRYPEQMLRTLPQGDG